MAWSLANGQYTTPGKQYSANIGEKFQPSLGLHFRAVFWTKKSKRGSIKLLTQCTVLKGDVNNVRGDISM